MTDEKSKNIIDKLREGKTYRKFTSWLESRTLPGFYGVSIYDTLKLAWKEAIEKDVYTRSYGVAYSVFISLFPFIIVIFSIVSLFPEANVLSYIDSSIEDIMPANAEAFLLDTVQSIIEIPRGGLLSLGFVLAIYFASNAMMTLMRGFVKDYEKTFKNRSWFTEKSVSIGLTVVIGLLLIISIGLIMAGDFFIRMLIIVVGYTRLLSILLLTVKWLIVLFSFLTAMGIIYRFGPAMKRKFKLFSPGAIIATIFCMMTSWGFSYFVNNFGTYNKIYGSIGAIIAIMVWIQLNCLIVLVGYEINASIALNRDHEITIEAKKIKKTTDD